MYFRIFRIVKKIMYRNRRESDFAGALGSSLAGMLFFALSFAGAVVLGLFPVFSRPHRLPLTRVREAGAFPKGTKSEARWRTRLHGWYLFSLCWNATQ